MKITETIERECCDPSKDLKIYKDGSDRRLRKCIHCGQIWEYKRELGEMDYGWQRVRLEKAD